MSGSLTVEVVYALPLAQDCTRVTLPAGASVRDAIVSSGVLGRHSEIDLSRQEVGIWNRRASLDAPLRDRDRVKIYRPLTADPKEVRRRRAQANRKG